MAATPSEFAAFRLLATARNMSDSELLRSYTKVDVVLKEAARVRALAASQNVPGSDDEAA